MDNYNNYQQPPMYRGSSSMPNDLTTRVSAVMKQVYFKMFLGLLVTAFISLWAAATPGVAQFFFTHSWAMWILVFAELGFVFAIGSSVTKMKATQATVLFFLFAALNGLTLFPIFYLYTGTSIAKTFFITAGTFGAMSTYGYFTTSDLTKWGSYLIMALIGLIICSIVNIFWANSTFDWIISGLGVLIFVGLTAWDTQQVKRMALMAPGEATSSLATIGALSLYLDFINLFLYLLRFFGSQRD